MRQAVLLFIYKYNCNTLYNKCSKAISEAGTDFKIAFKSFVL